MTPSDNREVIPPESDFEGLVELFYKGLYQFALGLTRNEAEASDLTQQTFYMWATKGQQLRDATKVKSWLFTTLYRDFLKARRRENRFPHQELSEVDHELPSVSPTVMNQMDASTVMQAFEQVDEVYRPSLLLFFLEDHSYQQIAEVLEVPIGTVMSRIARGRLQLQQVLQKTLGESPRKIIPFDNPKEDAHG